MLRKLKEALAQALKDGNRKLSTKVKKDLRKKRAEGFKPSFPGQHRGY